jgi:hypothetical protein
VVAVTVLVVDPTGGAGGFEHGDRRVAGERDVPVGEHVGGGVGGRGEQGGDGRQSCCGGRFLGGMAAHVRGDVSGGASITEKP